MVRDGLAMRIDLQPDLEVCGEAEGEDEAFALVRKLNPELVIIDISLKQGNGVDLIKRIKNFDRSVKMLVSSMYDEDLYAERALRAGAMGYLNKQESREKVTEAIRAILAGRRYLSPAMTQRMLSQALGAKPAKSGSAMDALTDRELEVFQLIGQGMTSGTIAAHLHLSPHTIDTHREKIKHKLNLKNANELSRAAIQWMLEQG